MRPTKQLVGYLVARLLSLGKKMTKRNGQTANRAHGALEPPPVIKSDKRMRMYGLSMLAMSPQGLSAATVPTMRAKHFSHHRQEWLEGRRMLITHEGKDATNELTID